MFKSQLAVISDIHGNRPALEAVLEDIGRRGIKKIVNLGDSLYGPLDPAGTAEILLPLHIPTVSGNEDRILVETSTVGAPSPTLAYVRECLEPEHLEWLKALPMTVVAYDDFFLCHGSPDRDDEYLLVDVLITGVTPQRPKELMARLSTYLQRVFLCGHDHVPRTVYFPEGRMIVDPGSVGLPAYSDDHPCPHAMETHTPHARYSIIREREKGWQVEHIAVPYDWEAAAVLAMKNNRPDWARWLRTGRTHG